MRLRLVLSGAIVALPLPGLPAARADEPPARASGPIFRVEHDAPASPPPAAPSVLAPIDARLDFARGPVDNLTVDDLEARLGHDQALVHGRERHGARAAPAAAVGGPGNAARRRGAGAGHRAEGTTSGVLGEAMAIGTW